MILEKVYDELTAQIEDLKKAVAAMSGGSDDYDDLSNRPKVNNITLTGNKKSSDLKIAYSMTEAEYAAATKNAESIYCLQENATTFEEEDETASASIEWSAGDPSGYAATWVYAPSNQNFTGCTAVDCDDTAITVADFSVVEGNVQVYLSCEDTTQIGETVTFTYTLTQPAGSTRIVKGGVTYTSPWKKTLYGSEQISYPAIQTADITLSDSFDNYDEIEVVCGWTADNVLGYRSFTTPSEMLSQTTANSDSDTGKMFLCGVNSKETQWVRISKGSSNNALHCRYNGSVGIYKIVGIKY